MSGDESRNVAGKVRIRNKGSAEGALLRRQDAYSFANGPPHARRLPDDCYGRVNLVLDYDLIAHSLRE